MDTEHDGAAQVKEIPTKTPTDSVVEKKETCEEKMEGQTAGRTTDVEMPRTIGLISGTSFIVGTIIGSGIFISPKGIAEGSGSVAFSIISWLICGFISLLGAFCFAELGTIVKESGADYAYLHAAYGSFVSYSYSWVSNILLRPAAMATISLTCAQYITASVIDDGCGDAPEVLRMLLAICVMMVLAAINIYSVEWASRVQVVFTAAKLIALAIIIIGGIVRLFLGHTQHLNKGFEGTVTNPGKIAVGFYSGMWSYDGWNTANFLTEEIINPERNLPLAIAIGVPLVIFAYVLTNISYFTVMSIEEMIASPAVAVTWAKQAIPAGAWLIPIFVAMSTFGAGNGSLFSSGRLVFASARNDHLPEALAMIHINKFTPIPSIIFTTVLGICFLVAGDINSLIDFMSFLAWIFYGLTSLAVIVFRYSKKYKHAKRAVTTPLVVPIIVFLASMFLVIAPIVMNPQIEFIYAIVFVIVGFILYIPFVFFKVRFRWMTYNDKFQQQIVV